MKKTGVYNVGLGLARLDSIVISHEGPRIHQLEEGLSMTAAHEIRNLIEHTTKMPLSVPGLRSFA